MKISLMTLNIFIPAFYRFLIERDREELVDTYEEMIQLASECGFTAVDCGMEVGVLGRETLRDILNRHPMKVGSFLYSDSFANPDEATALQRIENACKAVDTAAALGAKVIMLIPRGEDCLANMTREEIHTRLIRHWTPIAAYAQSMGLHPVVEDTPDLRLHLCRGEDVLAVVDAVPGLEVVYDSGNMILAGEDPAAYCRQMGRRIAHVHCKDMTPASGRMADTAMDGRTYACALTGQGIIDLKSVFRELNQLAYHGYVTLEFPYVSGGGHREKLIRCREVLETLVSR